MSAIFWISFAALWIIVVFQGLVLLGVTRGLLLVRGPAVENGTPSTASLIDQPAPAFHLRDLSGRQFDSDNLAGRPRALLFVSPGCSSCTATIQEFKSLSGKARGDVYIVCRGTTDECRELVDADGNESRVLIDDTFELSDAYRIRAVPTAVLINEADLVQTFGSPMRDGILARFDDRAAELAVAEA
jgi:peroxiredoxin